MLGATHAESRANVPIGERPRDGDTAGLAQSRSHVRDWKREKIAADQTRGRELIECDARLARGKIDARREHDEVGPYDIIRTDLGIGQAVDLARGRLPERRLLHVRSGVGRADVERQPLRDGDEYEQRQ